MAEETRSETKPPSGAQQTSQPEGLLARIISATQDAVVFIDTEACIVEFNRSAERIFGYAANEVLGRNVSVLMPEPYRSEHDGYLQSYERTGQARAIGVIRTVKGRRKSGEVFPIELSVTELPEGEPVRYAAFLRDISEKMAMQERLVERERLASLGMAAAILAHEIGNPLNGMYLEAQVLDRKLKKENSRDVHADHIMVEIKRLARLLDEFRSLSRADDTTFERCDLFEVGEYAAGHLETLARAANVSIRRDFPTEPVLVEGHPDKLRQVAINLAKNGIEAMPEGGTLTISLQAGPDLAMLMVGDTGAGIPEGVDILQPFRTTKASGTGLGLAIVKQIVVSHHGSIAWESTPGQGTKFKVTLPLARS